MTDRPFYTLETLPELAGSLPLYGVVGFPIAHSRSPAMQMAAFSATGLSARYVRIEATPERFEATIQKMKDLGFRGWNCTLPHKVAMLPFLQAQDPSVLRARAVNTVKNLEGVLTGYSTDGSGWRQALRDSFHREVATLRILLLGAGGSGQTLAREAIFAGCPHLTIANRSLTKAVDLIQSIRDEFGPIPRLAAIPWETPSLLEALQETDLLVNTTSVGLQPTDPPVIPPQLLRPDLLVYDLVYQKSSTPLVTAARQTGALAADGLSMLLYQGAEAFQIWTGLAAPIEPMKRTLL